MTVEPGEPRTGARRHMLAILFLLLGLGLIAAAASQAVSVHAFLRAAVSADATVVALNAGGSHPQIEFTAASGEKVSYPQGGLVFGYRPGDRVRVYYDARDPARTAQIDSPGALWFVPMILSAIGAISLLAGLQGILRF